MTQPFAPKIDRRNFLQYIGSGTGCALLSGCAALEKIDRGLYSANQSITHKDLITGERTIGFTDRQQQIKKGNSIMEKEIGKYSQLNEQVDRRAYSRLTRIFDRVHSVSHYSNENWRVFLLPDNTFNAFVTGGTYVAVNKGLMDETHDDAEVAGVLGHEIGHVVANHVFEKQSLMINLIAGDKIGSGFDFAYSTLNEEEADKVGVVYAALAGYNPHAVSDVWSRFAISGDNWAWFRTHPASSDRANATRILGERATKYYKPGAINPNHRTLSRCNNLWCNR